MAMSPLGPGDISLRDFIEAIGSADAAHGAVSTAAVAGGLGSLGLIRIGGHLSCGGYDVQTDGRHTEAPRAAAVH